MPSPRHQSVLLMERTVLEDGPVPAPSAPFDPRLPAMAPRSVARRRSGTVVPVFGSPALALLAAFSILEGYRWSGVIAGGGSLPWAVVFAGVSVPAAAALTRRLGFGDGHGRSVIEQAVVLAAVAGALATAVAVVGHGPWITHTVGIADLALAAAALGALATGERRRHRGHGRGGGTS